MNAHVERIDTIEMNKAVDAKVTTRVTKDLFEMT